MSFVLRTALLPAASIPFNRRLSISLLILLVLTQFGCSLSSSGRNVDGVRSFESGEYQAAIEDFQQALASDPKNANAYYNLGATYYAMGKQQGNAQLMQQSEGLYHQCLDLEPNHTDCYRGLACVLVDTNRSDSAFTLLKRWGTRNPNDPAPHIELARLHEEFGDHDNAARQLTDALHLDSSNARAWTALGRLREQEGQTAQALANYQQAYNLNKNQPGLAQHIASLQQNLAVAALQGNANPPTQMANTPSTTPPAPTQMGNTPGSTTR